jgi:murein L,D-transpeptidase YafK
MPLGSQFYSPYAFVVDKSARTLSVWQQTTNGLKRVAQFPADLGKNAGAKLKRDDHKTPEGVYFLLDRLDGNQIDFKLYGKRAFTTDYPNFFDRMDGKTGDGIWLHAVPDEVALTRGSRGCVVVRNDAILDLTQYVKLGRTPILIQDKTEFIKPEDWAKTTLELSQWLESWRSAWERKNLDAYMTKYDIEFKSMSMDRDGWRNFKSRLNAAYKNITVKMSKPAIFADRNRAVIRFLQEYTSDQHTDVGEKVLYLKKGVDGYKIVGETWAAESSDLAKQEIEAAKTPTAVTCTNGKADCVQTSSVQQQ